MPGATPSTAARPTTEPTTGDGQATRDRPLAGSTTGSAQPAVSDDNLLLEPVETLRALCNARLYGLAEAHVHALRTHIEKSPSSDLNSQMTIVGALVRALMAMECEQGFYVGGLEKLKPIVELGRPPAGRLASSRHVGIGMLAAGLGNLIFDDPAAGYPLNEFITRCVADLPAPKALMAHLEELRHHGVPLTRDKFRLSQVHDRQLVEKEMERMRTEAVQWSRAPAIYSTWSHRGFTLMHHEMFGTGNPIGQCIAALAKGDVAKLRSLYDEHRKRFEKPDRAVEEAYKRSGERTRPEGKYRILAMENVKTTERFILTYLELAERRTQEDGGLRVDEQKYLAELHVLLRTSREEIEEIASEAPSNALESLYVFGLLRAIDAVLALYRGEAPAQCAPTLKQKLLVQLPMGKDFLPALRAVEGKAKPSVLPEQVFSETARIMASLATGDDGAGDSGIDSALKVAYHEHVAAQRFLPASAIARELQGAWSPPRPTAEDLTIARGRLEAELQASRQKVVHALTLSAPLSQAEADRMQALLATLLQMCRTDSRIGRPDATHALFCDLPQAIAAHRELVELPVTAALEKAVGQLKVRLERARELGQASADDARRIGKLLTSDSASGLRAANDLLGMLAKGQQLPGQQGLDPMLGQEYAQTIERLRAQVGHSKSFLENMKAKLTQEGGGAPEAIAALDPEQRARAAEVIGAWVDFFETRSTGADRVNERLWRAIGFEDVKPAGTVTGAARSRFDLSPKTFRLRTSPDAPLFIPPELGSGCTALMCHAHWSVAQLETDLRNIYETTGRVPLVVMARVRWSLEKRALHCNRLPVLLVDDDLVAFAAMRFAERGEPVLHTIARVTLLTFRVNPFDDYDTLPVPPEMFFGRDQELDQLLQVKGLAVLFGGRRLGKSSLLSQLERDVNARPGSKAVYESMLDVDCKGDYALNAWAKLHETLVTAQIIKRMKPLGTTVRDIRQHVAAELKASGLAQLFLLLDETDDLMAQELARNEADGLVRSLVEMSESLQSAMQLKIVMAGLHNMTRWATDRNSVFGKSTDIALQPFVTSEDLHRGARLIVKPMAALGYRFQSDGSCPSAWCKSTAQKS